MTHDGITIKRVAVGVQSHDNAPAEYWEPREGTTELPDADELNEMLGYAERKLIGRPTDITVAVLFEAPGIPGKQLNRRTAYKPGEREDLETLMQQVVADCAADARTVNA